jgi:hypothetical protein
VIHPHRILCIQREKKNIPFVFDEVKETVIIPTNIARLMSRIDTPTAVAVGYVDQQEYSLNENIRYLLR